MIRSGRIDNSEIWSGQVQIKGDLLIPIGISVTVMPGTNVVFEHDNEADSLHKRELIGLCDATSCLAPFSASGKSCLIVEGTLKALGSKKERIIFIGSAIDDYVSNLVIAQLLFLSSEDPNKISIIVK